jgi:hypothetical protein
MLPATSSLSDPNILLGALFTNILSLCSLLSVRNQVSHPYQTTRKAAVLYTSTFKVLERRREYKRPGNEW